MYPVINHPCKDVCCVVLLEREREFEARALLPHVGGVSPHHIVACWNHARVDLEIGLRQRIRVLQQFV